MSESDTLVCQEILNYCDKIGHRIAAFAIDAESFTANDALADMLLMPVFQIGELANALSNEFITAHSDIPWHAIRGFRNVIAHDYGVVDPQWAWNTVEQDIPALAASLRIIVSES